MELAGRLAGDADPAVVHALQIVRRAEADEVFGLVAAARRAELDVVHMRGDAATARDLSEPAIPLEDLLLYRVRPLQNRLPERAEVVCHHPEALAVGNPA